MSKYVVCAILFSACIVMGSNATALASETMTIRVGVYDFPPVAVVNENNEAVGLLGDLLTALKDQHGNVAFNILHTSPRRRQLDFRSGLFDVIFFEHPKWDWDSEPVHISAPILKDEEVYLALNKEDRDQSFFDSISERRIVAIAGYHYGFAGLETDTDELMKHFDIELSNSHRRNIDLIKADRPTVAEVAVVSRSFLHNYFSRFPEQRELFLVSDRVDQTYELHVITRRDGAVSPETITGMLRPLIESGRYQELVRKHGLQLPENMPKMP